MHKMTINSTAISFPFKPYPAQILTCSKIIDCLTNKKTGIIESPTGTGKSIAILCSVLAWHASNSSSRIIICSRTHKQLGQLIDQLRKTVYTPRVCVLASRKVMCLNRRALRGDVNVECKDMVKRGECRYFIGRERLVKRMGNVHDIEDLRKNGEECTGCPYYASRILGDNADVIFMPYNYLIDPVIRESTGISLANAHVVIDEAHNIDDVCRSAGSIDLSTETLEIMLKELVLAYRKVGELQTEDVNYRDDLVVINYFLKKLTSLSDIKMTKSTFEQESTHFKGSEIVDVLNRHNIVPDLMGKLRANAVFKRNGELREVFSLMFLHTLETLVSIIFIIFSNKAQSYALILKRSKRRNQFFINFLLLDADVIFHTVLKKIDSLVLLSGTLAPFSAIENELNHKFAYSLIAPPVAEHTFCATVLRNARTKAELLGTYAHIETHQYMDEVISIILRIAGIVKDGGTVVFLPSYNAVNNILQRMKSRNSTLSNIFVETSDSTFDKVLASYRKHRNPVLLAVYRGKASEGTDFKDRLARAVVLVGLPCPNIRDINVELMRNHRPGWYDSQTFKAVNQAIGRCIRHKEDWGGIFLLDVRYRRDKGKICGWCRDRMVTGEYFEDIEKEFVSFVGRMRSTAVNGCVVKRGCADIGMVKKKRCD